MTESSLGKVLRLAGGTTRSYTRTEPSGRQVQVRQYASRPATAVPAAAKKPAAVKPGTSAGSTFGSLKVGQVIQILNQNYRVSRVNIPQQATGTSTGSQGTGLNTAKTAAGAAAAATAQANTGASQAAAAAAKLFGTPQQDPAKAALNGKPVPKGATLVHSLLTNLATGRYWYTSLPSTFAVKVVG